MIDEQPLIYWIREQRNARYAELGRPNYMTTEHNEDPLIRFLWDLQSKVTQLRDEAAPQVTKPKYPPIGSISEATMRPEDLIPAFTGELDYYAPEKAKELVEEFKDIYAALSWDAEEGHTFEDQYVWGTPEEIEFSESVGYLLEALFDALNEIAPPYTSFGAHEGDGACYGWWPDGESVEEDLRWGEVLEAREDEDGNEVLYQKQKDGRSFGLPEYAAAVTYHGNVTLYRVKFELEEIWGVV